MAWFIGGILIAIGVIFLLRWYATGDPKRILRTLTWTGMAFAVVVGLFLLLTGRLNFLWVALLGLLPWLMRGMQVARAAMFLNSLHQRAKAARGPSGGQSSTVNTRFVSMTLDHDTGAMDGIVNEGPFAGRSLASMSLDELVQLLRHAVQEDEHSAQVLQAYLDRTHGADWQEQAGVGGMGAGGESATRSTGAMSVDEACEILGLKPGASAAEIKAAHRRLMKQMHPDHGGSDYLATKINQAKDTLLSHV